MRPEDSLIFNRLKKEKSSKDHSQEKECEKELNASLSTKKYYLQIKIFFQ